MLPGRAFARAVRTAAGVRGLGRLELLRNLLKDAEEAGTGWLGQLEEYEFKRNARGQNVARPSARTEACAGTIVRLGDLARDVRKRWPGPPATLELDVLTQTLQENRTKTGG